MDEEQNNKIVQFINGSPFLVGLLYDLDLLPEQVEKDSKDYNRMITIAMAFREFDPREMQR